MTARNRIALLLIGLLPLLRQAGAMDLEAHLTRAITNEMYEPTPPAQLAEAGQLFLETLRARTPDAGLKARWAALGFNLQEITTTRETLWLLNEPAGTESGRGWFLFRCDPRSSLALQAPHPRNDVDTGLIGLRLFLVGNARVLAASTITRHKADAAHLDDTLFQSCTLAFARACPTGLVVQLHGFDAGRHPRLQADLVASAGTDSPEAWLAGLGRQMEAATALRVRVYPQETRELGATLNAQGRALRQTKRCRFLHLELSRDLRVRLTRDEALARAILDCISPLPAK